MTRQLAVKLKRLPHKIVTLLRRHDNMSCGMSLRLRKKPGPRQKGIKLLKSNAATVFLHQHVMLQQVRYQSPRCTFDIHLFS